VHCSPSSGFARTDGVFLWGCPCYAWPCTSTTRTCRLARGTPSSLSAPRRRSAPWIRIGSGSYWPGVSPQPALSRACMSIGGHEAPALSPGMAAREGAGEGRGRGARRRLRQHGCTGRIRHGGALFGRTPTCGRRSRRWSRCASRGTPIRAARSPRGATRRQASSRRVWRSGPLRCGATGSASPTFRPWRTPATTRRPHDAPATKAGDCVIHPSSSSVEVDDARSTDALHGACRRPAHRRGRRSTEL